jgi:hypothetical protein
MKASCENAGNEENEIIDLSLQIYATFRSVSHSMKIKRRAERAARLFLGFKNFAAIHESMEMNAQQHIQILITSLSVIGAGGGRERNRKDKIAFFTIMNGYKVLSVQFIL